MYLYSISFHDNLKYCLQSYQTRGFSNLIHLPAKTFLVLINHWTLVYRENIYYSCDSFNTEHIVKYYTFHTLSSKIRKLATTKLCWWVTVLSAGQRLIFSPTSYDSSPILYHRILAHSIMLTHFHWQTTF